MPINFTATYIHKVGDSGDHTGDVGTVSAIGPVYFEPQFPYGLTALDVATNTGYTIPTVAGYLDSDGVLKRSRGGEVGVRLWANDPIFGLQRLPYKVTFELTDPMGQRKIPRQGTTFDAPASDTTVPLTNVLPVPNASAVAIPRTVTYEDNGDGTITFYVNGVAAGDPVELPEGGPGGGASAWGDLSGRPARLIAGPNVANGYAGLDAGGKLGTAQLPDLALIQFKGSKADQAAMLATTGESGDWVIRTDTTTGWIITGADPTQLASWTQLPYPSMTWTAMAALLSSNGAAARIALGVDVAGPPRNQVMVAARGINVVGGEHSYNPATLPGTYGTDYSYESATSLAYIASRGHKIIRLPFKWERIQPTRNAALNATELQRLKDVVARAYATGMSVVLDLHNYARFTNSTSNGGATLVLGTDFPAADLVDVWTRLSTAFKNNPGVYAYGLMNEPHDIGGGVAAWEAASQAMVTGIRNNRDDTLIMVGGYTWSGAHAWTTAHPNGSWIVDPANNFKYEAHYYFDYSGTYTQSYATVNASAVSGGYANLAARATAEFSMWVNWLNTNGVQGYLGEVGWPNGTNGTGDTASWDALGTLIYNLCNANNIDVTYFSTGERAQNDSPISAYLGGDGDWPSLIPVATAQSPAAIIEQHKTRYETAVTARSLQKQTAVIDAKSVAVQGMPAARTREGNLWDGPNLHLVTPGTENNYTHLPHLFNDIAYNNARGGSVTVTRNGSPYSPGSPELFFTPDSMGPDLNFTNPSDVFVIEVAMCSVYNYEAWIGLAQHPIYFARNVTIERYNVTSNSWTTVATKTNLQTSIMKVFTSGWGGTNAFTKVRYTLSNFATTSPALARITNLFVMGGDSPLLGAAYLPLGGGTLYGALSGVTPTAAAHLARKDYVDAQVAGVAGGSYAGGVPFWAGSYHRLNNEDPSATLGMNAATVDGNIFIAGRTATLTQLGVQVTTAGSTGAVIRFGLYSLIGNAATLVTDFGAAAATSTGFISVTGSAALVAGRKYMAVAVSQGAPTTRPTVRITSTIEQWGTEAGFGSASSLMTQGISARIGGSGSATGALPANGTLEASGTPPAIAGRCAA